MKALEQYESEAHRQRRKTQRRIESLNKIALRVGFDTWRIFETAVINGDFIINPAPADTGKG
jgi:hypothetical protein